MKTTEKQHPDKLTSQQRWNAQNKEKRNESGRRQREKYKRIEVKLDKVEDRELIEWLANSDSQQKTLHTLIKEAYLKDIESNPSVQTSY